MKTENKTAKQMKEEIESYIAKVGHFGGINVRKAFRKYGLIKISMLTKQETKEYIKNKKSLLKKELEIIKEQEEFRKHLTKLRELRYGRKRIL